MIKVITDNLEKTSIGNLLEALSQKLLTTQGYEVKKQLRLTGVEIDLLCEHKTSKKTLLVECKAHSKNIESHVVSSLYGQRDIKSIDEAWLISTSELTKDANGLVLEIKNSGNKNFSVYTPGELIRALIDSGQIKDSIIAKHALESVVNQLQKITNEYLVISEKGYFWCFESKVGTEVSCYFFDAGTAQSVTETELLQFFKDSTIFEGKKCSSLEINGALNDEMRSYCPEKFTLSGSYLAKIKDIGLRITHPNKNTLDLEDIFIYQDLELIESDDRTSLSSKNIIAENSKHTKSIIFGEDLSGKTTLSQTLQKDLNEMGFISLYIEASDIKGSTYSKFSNVLTNKFKKQYSDDKKILGCFEEILANEPSKIAIIIDNYEGLAIKRSPSRQDFHVMLNSKFDCVLIFANKSLEIEVMASSEIRSQLNNFSVFKIKQLGHVLLDQLIEKWIIVEDGEVLTDSDVHNKKQEIANKVRVAVGANFIPMYPLYLLTVLQLTEITSKSKLQGSSYAELYSYLINQSLGSAKAKPADLDFYHTYLAYLAFSFYSSNNKTLTESELKSIYNEYCTTMDLENQFNRVHELLISAKILNYEEGTYKFSHNYSYYFFVAKYFAENSEDKAIENEVNQIINKLYRTEYANIVLFLIHHSKSKELIEKITQESKSIFPINNPYTLAPDEMKHISSLIESEIGFTIKERNPEEYRKELLEQKDKEPQERHSRDDHNISSRNELDLFGNINLSFKVIEILGQLTQSYYGSLTGNKKEEILTEIHSLGFRSLSVLLESYGDFVDVLRTEIERLVDQKGTSTDDKKREISDKIISEFTEFLVMVFLKKVSDSVTSKEIFITLNKIVQKNPSPANLLVNTAVKLNFPDSIDINEIVSLDKQFEKNVLARKMLRRLAVEHMYKFNMPYQTKQSLCTKLGIKFIQKQGELGIGRKK